jgi:hypothetical protein
MPSEDCSKPLAGSEFVATARKSRRYRILGIAVLEFTGTRMFAITIATRRRLLLDLH